MTNCNETLAVSKVVKGCQIGEPNIELQFYTVNISHQHDAPGSFTL